MIEPFVVLDRHDVRIEVYDGLIVVYRYSPNVSPSMGKSIDSRMVTFEDRTVEDRFASAIPMARVPPLPLARLAMAPSDVKKGVRKQINLTLADRARRTTASAARETTGRCAMTEEPTIIDRRRRRTEIRDGLVVQYVYVDQVHATADKLIEERITTTQGQSLSEKFESPLPHSALPKLPLQRLARTAKLARLSGLGIAKGKDQRDPSDKRSRLHRLKEARAKHYALHLPGSHTPRAEQ